MTKRQHIKNSPVERKKKKIYNKNNNNIKSDDESEEEIIEKINYREEYYTIKKWNEHILEIYQMYNITSINELCFALNYYNKIFIDEKEKYKYINKQDYLLIEYKKMENKIKSVKLKNIKKKYKNHINNLNNIDEKLKKLEKEFDDYYNNNLTLCKEISCKTKVGNDISYCIKHMPKVCEKCNHMCDINDKTDRLHYNKKYNIINFCKICANDVYFEDYCEKYKLEHIFYMIDEKEKYYKTKKALSKSLYLNMKRDSDIFNEIENKNELQEKEVLEFLDYNVDDYNEFTKYKLYNRLKRSKDLIETFDEHLKNIKIKTSFYSYISNVQFDAFKKFLYKLLNIDEIENIFRMATL